jgi:hypothetical protein
MIQKKRILLLLLLLVNAFLGTITAQTTRLDSMSFRGKIVEILITEDNDTIIIGSDFDEITVSGNRYKTRKEAYHYDRTKIRALKVYPYATKAVQIFEDINMYTLDLKKRNRKQHIQRLHKELKVEFEDPLKKLSRYEGYVLMCMVERELNQPLYEVVKTLKGWFPANYWSNMAKMYGYDITSGYDPKDDPILENILADLEISRNLVKQK